MILLDFQQVAIANLSRQLGNHTNAELDEGMLRHMVLNTIRSIYVRFKANYGELVIACDARNSWRYEVFPYYKQERREARRDSELDWTMIFDCLSKIRNEIKEFFPYRVIHVDGAEADDIIGTLCRWSGAAAEETDSIFDVMNIPAISQKSKIMIVSGDKDFKQLHVKDRIVQWDTTQKKDIYCPDPKLFLKEHIIRGDRTDGIPNFLSPDNCFIVPGIRQKQIREVKLKEWLGQPVDVICDTDEKRRNWARNEQLIDLSRIPSKLQMGIQDVFAAEAGKGRSKLTQYFMEKRLKTLHEKIGEF